MVKVERIYIKKRDKNYIRISGFKKGEVWNTTDNNEVSIFIPEDKFEDIKNAEIIDRTTKKADKISELEKRISRLEGRLNKVEKGLSEIKRTVEEIKRLLDREGERN